jgi:thiamine pyrophosphokinase
VTGIITRGLKYPLTNGFLENGVSDGSSNSVVSSPVAIIHEEGDLLLFIVK